MRRQSDTIMLQDLRSLLHSCSSPAPGGKQRSYVLSLIPTLKRRQDLRLGFNQDRGEGLQVFPIK